MKENPTPVDVKVFESGVDELAQSLTLRIIEASRPVRARNNKRWEEFAKLCRVPVVGDIYFKQMHGSPQGLESEPDHHGIEGFDRDVKRIEEMAEELEEMKRLNMDVFGDEIVQPANSGDPAGYYTPNFSTRRACYEILHLKPFIPDKWDFHSAAGTEKYDVGIKVMTYDTKEIIEFNDAVWSWQAGVGVRYRRKNPEIKPKIDSRGLGMVFNERGIFETFKDSMLKR